MTDAEVGEVLALIYAAYPRTESSKQTIRVFTIGLSDMDADCAKAAAVEWVRDHKWPPSLAELRWRAKDLQDSRRGVSRTQQAAKALPAGSGNDAKARAQIANIAAWQEGLIDDETRMRDSARIYAEMEPIPSDGPEVMAATEAEIEALRERRAANGGNPVGAMAGQLRGAVGRMAPRSNGTRSPTPQPGAGPAGGRKDQPRRRRRSGSSRWWDRD